MKKNQFLYLLYMIIIIQKNYNYEINNDLSLQICTIKNFISSEDYDEITQIDIFPSKQENLYLILLAIFEIFLWCPRQLQFQVSEHQRRYILFIHVTFFYFLQQFW